MPPNVEPARLGAPAGGRVANAPHAEAGEAVVERLCVDATKGLSEDEARKRIAKDGKNELPPPPKPNWVKRFFLQFANPIVGTLLVAAVIALIDGAQNTSEPLLVRFGDATAILIIVAINAVLGFYQERRAEAALDALQKMQVPNARVRRCGGTATHKVSVVPATELVAGDILELEAGDAVPADARLVQTANVATEESALTGESIPSARTRTRPSRTTRPSATAPTWSSSARASSAEARDGRRHRDGGAHGDRQALDAHPQRGATEDAPRGEARVVRQEDPLDVPRALGAPLRPRLFPGHAEAQRACCSRR